MESPFLARDQALSIWTGSSVSKTLGYQTTPNPIEYQIVRTPMKAITCIQDPASPNYHPVQDASSNTKQDKNSKTITSNRITTSLSHGHRAEGGEGGAGLTSSHQKARKSCTLQEPYTNHWTKLTRTETKRKKEFNLEAWKKETSSTVS